MDEDVHTTLAIVQTKPDGDRDFSFYRRPGADMMLTEEQIPEELIRNSRIFHYGTLSMTDEPVRSATRKAIAAAEEAGLVLSFDPNLRPPLWNTLEEAREQICYGLAHCHILKISDGKAKMLTADCPDQLCVHQQAISKESQTIVCLPNKVVAEVTGNTKKDYDAVVQ